MKTPLDLDFTEKTGLIFFDFYKREYPNLLKQNQFYNIEDKESELIADSSFVKMLEKLRFWDESRSTITKWLYKINKQELINSCLHNKYLKNHFIEMTETELENTRNVGWDHKQTIDLLKVGEQAKRVEVIKTDNIGDDTGDDGYEITITLESRSRTRKIYYEVNFLDELNNQPNGVYEFKDNQFILIDNWK